MNKADIDEMIKWFATYISKPLKFGARHKIKNTGMILKYNIEISHPDAKGYHDVEEYYNMPFTEADRIEIRNFVEGWVQNP